jgi:hypothetical protein
VGLANDNTGSYFDVLLALARFFVKYKVTKIEITEVNLRNLLLV